MNPHILTHADLDRLARDAHDEAVAAMRIPRWVWVAYGAVVAVGFCAGAFL